MTKVFKILLIDDEDEFRFLIKTDLENEGFQVFEAADGLTGIERAVIDQPDLILLDLNMPEPDGQQVYEMIKNDKRIGQIPVIILTTGDDLSEHYSQLMTQADDYIGKAVDPKERSARIRTILAKKR